MQQGCIFLLPFLKKQDNKEPKFHHYGHVSLSRMEFSGCLWEWFPRFPLSARSLHIFSNSFLKKNCLWHFPVPNQKQSSWKLKLPKTANEIPPGKFESTVRLGSLSVHICVHVLAPFSLEFDFVSTLSAVRTVPWVAVLLAWLLSLTSLTTTPISTSGQRPRHPSKTGWLSSDSWQSDASPSSSR